MLTALALLAAIQTTPPVQTPTQAAPSQTAPSQTAPKSRSIESANLILQRLRKEAYSPSSHFYGEEWNLGRRPTGIAFNWSVGVLLSGLASAAKTDPKMKTPLLEFTTSSVAYWNDDGPVPGFDVLPGPKPIDRYYDDNAWMVLGLMEAYDATKKVELLVRARDAYAYALSGESKSLGGGIFWRESDKASKNTCSNAPVAYAALGLYERTKDKRYLADAIRIYRWTDETLRDPADGLMWDSVAVPGVVPEGTTAPAEPIPTEPKIERTKWSYNTALMLKTEHKLLELKAIPSLTKTQLIQRAESAAKRWVLPNGAFRDEGKFAHMLFEALLICETPSYGEAEAKRTLAFLRDEAVDKAGHYGPRWEAKSEGPVMKPKMIDQASAMRAFAFAAERGINAP